MKSKTLAFILALLMLSTVSCGVPDADSESDAQADAGTAANGVTDDTETEEDTSVKTDLPANLDFNGATYRIHNIDCGSYYDTLVSFEINGNNLNDAIFYRDQSLMKELDFKFEETVVGDPNGEAVRATKNLIMSGDTSYNQYVLVDWSGYTVALEGYALPISALPYIDLTREYWAQSIHEDISIRGELYFAFGDHNLSTYDSVSVLMFNKAMAADLQLADHYETVLEGKWTLDIMKSNMETATNDADGNGVWDDNDRYGITSHSKQVLPVFWIASDMRTIEKNEEDVPVFTLESNEKFISLYEKILNMMHNDHLLFMSDDFPDYANNTLFIEGGALYNIARAAFLEYYRDMDIDFGIIPFPKYDDAQEKYCSRTEGAYIHIYPTTLENREFAGAVTEAMACESLNKIIPEYYDVVLKSKYARDPNSKEMLDLIYSNRFYDLGDTLFCGTIRDGVFAERFKNNDINLASQLKALGKLANLTIQEYVDAFDSLEQP